LTYRGDSTILPSARSNILSKKRRKDKTIDTGKRGKEHVLKYHSSHKKVEYILNMLNGKH
jgi:hypothetical protein